jgi:phosphatidylethanolamine/phosphatidyl-N-methylethanolamine N-methyltransferase
VRPSPGEDADMDLVAIQKVYRRYAEGYDLYFGALFEPGRRAVIERLCCQRGESVLEVGVGTGLSLPLYPRDVQVIGIDISIEMLQRACTRCRKEQLDQMTALARMDAERMAFTDNSFDKVVAMYVASVVPDPVRLVAEMQRVCKPDGELFIVNHFQHDNRLVGGVEKMFAPLSRLMGFRPDVSLEHFIATTGLAVSERVPVNLFGYWTLLRAHNDKH